MAGKLEERIFWDCSIREEEKKVLDSYHNTNKFWQCMRLGAVIDHAYFGRNALSARCDAPIGLNVRVITAHGDASETISYTTQKDVTEFMKSFGALRAQELVGKKVIAYMTAFFQLAGLSVRRQ